MRTAKVGYISIILLRHSYHHESKNTWSLNIFPFSSYVDSVKFVHKRIIFTYRYNQTLLWTRKLTPHEMPFSTQKSNAKKKKKKTNSNRVLKPLVFN